MKPQRPAYTDPQRDLFRAELEQLVDPRHSLVHRADQIQWKQFEATFAPLFSDAAGRPACAVRLMISLHYLKHSFDLSDEASLAQWGGRIRTGSISVAASSSSIGGRFVRP